MLSGLAGLLARRRSPKRFTYYDLKGQDFLIGCSTEAQIDAIHRLTGGIGVVLEWGHREEREHIPGKRRAEAPSGPRPPISCKSWWIARERGNTPENYAAVLSGDPLEDWDRCVPSLRGGTLDLDLHFALIVLYGDGDAAVSRALLERCFSVSDRALSADLCRKMPPGEERSYWSCQARALRARAYSRALLGGPLAIEDLREAARCFFEQGSERSDDCDTSHVLAGVRICALLGDWPDALTALKGRCRGHKIERETLAALCRSELATVREDYALRQRLAALVDEARAVPLQRPIYRDSTFQPFELAAILYRWFESPDGEMDWKRVTDIVSA